MLKSVNIIHHFWSPCSPMQGHISMKWYRNVQRDHSISRTKVFSLISLIDARYDKEIESYRQFFISYVNKRCITLDKEISRIFVIDLYSRCADSDAAQITSNVKVMNSRSCHDLNTEIIFLRYVKLFVDGSWAAIFKFHEPASSFSYIFLFGVAYYITLIKYVRSGY